MSLVSDLQTYLADQSLVDGGTGWTSVRRREHDGVDQLVILTEDGGTAPEIGRAAGVGSGALHDAGVQIRCRGSEWDSDASEAKAQQIFDLLHGQTGITIGSTTYLRIAALTSRPVFVGFDDKGRPSHSISFRFSVGALA